MKAIPHQHAQSKCVKEILVLQIECRRHGSNHWRMGSVLERRRGEMRVDFNGTNDWVSTATHEIVELPQL